MTDPVTYTGDDGPPAPGDPELVSADDQARAAMAGALLVARAGDLWDALLKIADSNTARDAIEVVTDVALSAALANPGDTP